MKILELRFKNLNSLYGEWLIDFTNPEYLSNGIFALTGPTGAGKSTILDAICLALYGATPRLGKITKSGNEIMSRQTGECYAEVLFESQAGRFRCHWEQRRARKKAEGNLQDQEHQIADADTGKPIETKKSLVTGVIEEKTGMDFDRFTRSILLAQGGFDTFLKADAEQKSKILEQITGTEIYSEISRRVHQRQRSEQENLTLLQAETSGILILEPEQEKEIRLNVQTKQSQETVLADKVTETSKAIAWLTTINGLKEDIDNLAQEAIKLQNECEIFKPERDKLDQAIKAASLDGVFATLTAMRKQQAEDKANLSTEETALPTLEASAAAQATSLKLAEQQTVKAKEEMKAAAPLMQKIRSLDQKLALQKKTISEHIQSCTQEAAKIEVHRQDCAKEQEKRTAALKTLEIVACYLNTHARDEWLISGLAGIEEQLSNLLSKQKDIDQKEVELKHANAALLKATKQYDNSTTQCRVRKQELSNVIEALQQGKDALSNLLGDRLLREYRAEKETLLREMAFLTKIAELEDHRAKLEDGNPCPLCGAIEHPFAENNTPTPDATEQKIEALSQLISQAENIEAANRKLQDAEVAARQNLTDSERQEASALGDKKAVEKTLVEIKDALAKLQTSFAEQKQAVAVKLQPLGVAELPATQVASVLASLNARLHAWQEQVKKKAECERQIAHIDSEIKHLTVVIDTQSVALSESQKRLQALQDEQVTGTQERVRLYGDRKPDAEEVRLDAAVVEAERAEKTASSQNIALQQKLTTAKAHVDALKRRLTQRAPELENAETDFSSAVARASLIDEKHFLEARLTNEARAILSAKAKTLDDTQTDLKARQKDRATRLEGTIAQKITEKTFDELTPQCKEFEAALKDLREVLASLKHKLNENAAAKERVKEKQAAIDAQKKECQRWDKLHNLIGSADGKKYRNFAQGLTFELMVAHTNRQLEKMTDRYLLIRDEEQPLELNVIDNYQAGEIRSTRNLSGGESFIVSLTLALGLSKMSSRKVRVDSLFLDEGFGTLDEDALETALETLSGLQQDGKLIGIISHVSALKERISTQITIAPASGGRSSLAGPGCRKIETGDDSD